MDRQGGLRGRGREKDGANKGKSKPHRPLERLFPYDLLVD